MKTMAWESVTEKVNAVSLQCTRGVVEVKKKWQDMQSAVKKKEAQRRKNLTQTGGGTSQLPMLKPWEEKILQLIPQSAISGIEDGVDTSEVRSSLQMSQKPSCLEIQPFIVTEVPAEELVMCQLSLNLKKNLLCQNRLLLKENGKLRHLMSTATDLGASLKLRRRSFQSKSRDWKLKKRGSRF
nr:uncharacterized protein LOC117685280 [Crassostrea gigas]